MCVFAITAMSSSLAAQELEVEILYEESKTYNEIPSASTFEELKTPQINPELIPEAKLPPPAPDLEPQPANIAPKSVVKPQPAIRTNVSVSPENGTGQPETKRKSSVTRTNSIAKPVPQNRPQANTTIVEEIPVVGIELSSGDSDSASPQTSNSDELDRR